MSNPYKLYKIPLSKNACLEVDISRSQQPTIMFRCRNRLENGDIGTNFIFNYVDNSNIGPMKDAIDLAYEHQQRLLKEKDE